MTKETKKWIEQYTKAHIKNEKKILELLRNDLANLHEEKTDKNGIERKIEKLKLNTFFHEGSLQMLKSLAFCTI